MFKSILFLIVFFLLSENLFSQLRSGDIPSVRIEQIVNSKKKFISIPWARKGESLDTTIYRINPIDTFIFAHTISHLFGSGGALPPFRVFFKNYKVNYSASIGSYLTPEVNVVGDYIDDLLQAQGKIDLSYTNGHINNSNNLSLNTFVSGTYKLTTDLPFLDTFNTFTKLSYKSNSYNLYGNTIDSSTRFRSESEIELGIKNTSESKVKYNIHFGLEGTSLIDNRNSSPKNYSELYSKIGSEFNFKIAKIVNAIIAVDIKGGNIEIPLNSLQISPSLIKAKFIIESKLSDEFLITIGAVYYNSSIGTTNENSKFLAAPVSVSFTGLDRITLFAKYLPEFKVQTINEISSSCPYIFIKNIIPEKTPSKAEVGAKYNSEILLFETKVFIEQSENKAYINSNSDSIGYLFLDYLESDLSGLNFEGSFNLTPFHLNINSVYSIAKKARTDTIIPMSPTLKANSKIGYDVNNELRIEIGSEFITEQNTSLLNNTPRLPSSLLFSIGGSYYYNNDITFILEGKNITNQKKYSWNNYLAPGLEIVLGVRGNLY